MPPSASLRKPAWSAPAPENEPFLCPKSADFARSPPSVAQCEVAAERRAVDGHEIALDLVGLLFQQVDLLGELALARARGTGEQDGVRGADGHALNRLDQVVEVGVARRDALFEEGEVLLAFGLEPLGEGVVAREVEVDHVDHALGVVRVADVSFLR